MIASAEAQEELDNIYASIGDLIPPSPSRDDKKMVAKSWDFGPSRMTEALLKELEDGGCFAEGQGHLPHRGETVPMPKPYEAVVFKDFFTSGLRIPPVYFLRQVLEFFNVQLHHLTPNEILALSKFCYACEMYGAAPDIDTFCAHYELQKTPKRGKVDGMAVEFQFGSCAFMAHRF